MQGDFVDFYLFFLGGEEHPSKRKKKINAAPELFAR